MALKSFIDIAPDSHFPLENLPFGVFKPRDGDARIGVALGDYVVDLAALQEAGHFPDLKDRQVFARDSLNEFLALGRSAWKKVREILQELLSADVPTLRDDKKLRERVFHRQSEVEMLLPARIGNYTDFYSSYHHAHNVGTMLRGPENALMPNWKWLPVAYHGRASSVVVSGSDVRRPKGQTKPPDAPTPVFGPTKSLDYELEMAFLVGPGNSLGQPVPIDQAADHIFGFVLMNDWSARDIQAWEYVPLGPFLAKNFATTVSPWVVTAEALAPFRTAAFARPQGDPAPLPYLDDPNDRREGGLAITLEAYLLTQAMREQKLTAFRLSSGTFADIYWTVAQMLAHHTSNGCNLMVGDLMGSGTVSGPGRDSWACLLELTSRGREPLELPSGEKRGFLEDRDEIIFRGHCEREDFARIGFGECRAVVQPAANK
jgi:fumarylacetoacetase